MFKDIYKAANDDIKPDPYLLCRILNKSKEKSKPFFYRHRVAVFAAVIALFIALPGIINNPEYSDSTVLDQAIIPEAQNDKTYFILSSGAADSTKESASGNTSTDISSAKTASTEELIDYTNAKEMTVVMSINSFSPATQTASLARSSEDASPVFEVEELTAGQYFDMLGFFPDILSMPEGLYPTFTNDSTVTITKRDGELLSDENTFSYSGENFLMFTTSSSMENTLFFINSDQYEKSVFGDKNAVILFDGSVYEAHIIHSSGTALKFVTDLPEEQLKNLRISAAK